jgi:hypothetical protein
MNNNNETIFRPNTLRITIELLSPFLVGVFFVLGYFSFGKNATPIIKTLLLVFSLYLFLFFLRVVLFTPTLIKIGNSTIAFKKIIPPFSYEIPQSAITRIHIQWRPDSLWTSLYGKWHPLSSITIYTNENGNNKTYYLFMFAWEAEARINPKLVNRRLVESIKKIPLLNGKIVETTKSRLSLLWS